MGHWIDKSKWYVWMLYSLAFTTITWLDQDWYPLKQISTNGYRCFKISKWKFLCYSSIFSFLWSRRFIIYDISMCFPSMSEMFCWRKVIVYCRRMIVEALGSFILAPSRQLKISELAEAINISYTTYILNKYAQEEVFCVVSATTPQFWLKSCTDFNFSLKKQSEFYAPSRHHRWVIIRQRSPNHNSGLWNIKRPNITNEYCGNHLDKWKQKVNKNHFD